MKTLIAGPWVGEFGWELFAWHGYVRALSKNCENTVVISRNNSESLYTDFADEFFSFDALGGLPDAFFMHNVSIEQCLKTAIREYNIPLTKDTTLLVPRRIGIPPHTHYSQHVLLGENLLQPLYVQLGHEKTRTYDVIFHVRRRELRKEDNWSAENWLKLRELLGKYKVACIGTSKESGWIEGTDDLRDIPLGELTTVLRNAGCGFGRSSGPMHLMSLCGLPHVVWSIVQNKRRYEENWNPLDTKVLFLSDHEWHPSAEYVYERFLEWQEFDGGVNA